MSERVALRHATSQIGRSENCGVTLVERCSRKKWWSCIIIRSLPRSILRLPYNPYNVLSQTLFKRRQHGPHIRVCFKREWWRF
jgi:hypothetical protein